MHFQVGSLLTTINRIIYTKSWFQNMYLCVHTCAYCSALPFPQAKQGRSELLEHPLVTSLLDQKWNKLGAWCYFTNLLVYVAFVFFLTMFALAVRNPLSDSCKHSVCIMKCAVAYIHAWIQELEYACPCMREDSFYLWYKSHYTSQNPWGSRNNCMQIESASFVCMCVFACAYACVWCMPLLIIN